MSAMPDSLVATLVAKSSLSAFTGYHPTGPSVAVARVIVVVHAVHDRTRE